MKAQSTRRTLLAVFFLTLLTSIILLVGYAKKVNQDLSKLKVDYKESTQNEFKLKKELEITVKELQEQKTESDLRGRMLDTLFRQYGISLIFTKCDTCKLEIAYKKDEYIWNNYYDAFSDENE